MFSKPLQISAFLVVVALFAITNFNITRLVQTRSLTPATPTPVPTQQTANTELDSLKAEVARLRSNQLQLQQVLTASSSASSSVSDYLAESTKLITPNSKFPSVDVFELPVASGKIIEQITAGKNYAYTTKQNSWYQIQLADGRFGWVQADLVVEP